MLSFNLVQRLKLRFSRACRRLQNFGRRRNEERTGDVREIVFEVENWTITKDQRALDQVLQLSYVSRPRVTCELICGGCGDAVDLFAKAARIPRKKKHRELRNVLASFPERWHLERKSIQPVIKIGAKRAFVDRFLEISIR